MRKINKPTYDVAEIVKDCVESFRDVSKRNAYKDNASYISKKSREYDSYAQKNELYRIRDHSLVNGVLTKEDMVKLYDSKFVGYGSVRAKYYDKIKASSNQLCPICGLGVVTTLDHYLAKATYPTYSISPCNLVPMCFDCNKNKDTWRVLDYISSPLHPYYDEVDNLIWLAASLQISEGQIVAQYFVNSDIKKYNEDLFYRMENHFRLYNLNLPFSIRAATEIAESREKWIDDYKLWGEELFLNDLGRELKSSENYQRNTWKTALIRALIENVDILNLLSSPEKASC